LGYKVFEAAKASVLQGDKNELRWIESFRTWESVKGNTGARIVCHRETPKLGKKRKKSRRESC